MKYFAFDINETIVAFDSTEDQTQPELAQKIVDKYLGVYKTKAQKKMEEVLGLSEGEEEIDEQLNEKLKEKLKDEVCQFLTKNKQKLFTSFLKVLDLVLDDKNDVGIMLRTFGEDGENVMQLIMEYLKSKSSPTAACNEFTSYEMKRKVGAKFEIKQKGDSFVSYDLDGVKSWFDSLQHKFVFIKDDYQFWNSHSRQSRAGKIAFTDNIIRFFDDNDCVCMYAVDPSSQEIVYDSTSKTFKKIKTFNAMCDENYFVKNLLHRKKT